MRQWRQRLIVVLALAVTALVLLSAFAAIENSAKTTGNSTPVAVKKPFYVGVTYCGDSVTEAEQLINQVKNYTNLFVLQSGSLMDNFNASEQILDYAVHSGLNIIIYYSTKSLEDSWASSNLRSLLSIAPTRWGNHFLGLYFNDEPGGHMLDGPITFNTDSNYIIGSISKNSAGAVSFTVLSGSSSFSQITVYPSGEINVNTIPNTPLFGGFSNQNQTSPSPATVTTNLDNDTTYFSNGTITFSPYSSTETFTYEPNGTVFGQNGQCARGEGNISQFTLYKQVLNLDPLLNCSDAADLYVDNLASTFLQIGNQTNVNFFTSDYGLYWWDYQAGYNTVFAELFGSQTDAQTLALIRGAADMQGKSWGVMIEPSCQLPLTLQSSNQMYNELREAYEDGAEYAVVFNYSPFNNATGLLQDQQFEAIQNFWESVVQNPEETNNVGGQVALVLPADYGWGMRSKNDTIWGIWGPDTNSPQVWDSVQQSLAKYGSRLDIVFADSAYPATENYQRVIYWNQTARKPFLLIKQLAA